MLAKGTEVSGLPHEFLFIVQKFELIKDASSALHHMTWYT